MSTLEGLYGACSEIEVALDCLFRKQGYRPAYADNSLAKIRAAIGDGLFPKPAENAPKPAESAPAPREEDDIEELLAHSEHMGGLFARLGVAYLTLRAQLVAELERANSAWNKVAEAERSNVINHVRAALAPREGKA
jgi:hypothetical protein